MKDEILEIWPEIQWISDDNLKKKVMQLIIPNTIYKFGKNDFYMKNHLKIKNLLIL